MGRRMGKRKKRERKDGGTCRWVKKKGGKARDKRWR